MPTVYRKPLQELESQPGFPGPALVCVQGSGAAVRVACKASPGPDPAHRVAPERVWAAGRSGRARQRLFPVLLEQVSPPLQNGPEA